MAQYDLSAASVDAIGAELRQYFTSCGVSKRETLRLALMAEEALLQYADRFGTECEVEFNTSRIFRHYSIQLVIKCDRMDPFAAKENSEIMGSLMADCTKRSAVWRYRGGVNQIVFSAQPEKRIDNLWKILIALVSGLALGFVAKHFMGAESYSVLLGDYIQPLTNSYTGILCVMAILMIFFTLPLGIVQLESSAAFHRLARRILASYMQVTSVLLIVTAAVSVFFLPLSLRGGAEVKVFKSTFDIFLSFLPGGLVSPFLNFNCMQVLVVGAMFGFSFLAMGEQSRGLVSAFDKCNLVAVFTNNYLTRFIPYYVGLMAFSGADTAFAGKLMPILLRIVPITFGGAILLLGGFTAAVCIRLKVSARTLWKKLSPAFLVHMSSASVGAGFQTMFNEMLLDCGVDVTLVSISCNLGTILFKPLYSVFLSAAAMFAASYAGMSVSPLWVVLVIILSPILSMAIPNIQGGAASLIVLLFSQLGLDGEVSNAMISVNAVLQFLIVPINVFSMQCLMLLTAAREGKIDLETLRDPVSVVQQAK